MRYVYAMAGSLERKPKVGDGDCVALVRFYAHAPNHRVWKEGEKVLDLGWPNASDNADASSVIE